MPITLNKKVIIELQQLYDNYIESYAGIYGDNWYVRAGIASPWTSLAVNENNGHMLAVSNNSTTTNTFSYSNDGGITWIGIDSSALFPSANTNQNWRSVTFGNGRFVGISLSLTLPNVSRIFYSTGTTTSAAPTLATHFTYINSPENNNWDSVTYGNGYFVAVANSGTTNRIMRSKDGISWSLIPTPSGGSVSWESVTYSSDLKMFLAVSRDGTNRVMFSKYNGKNWTAVPGPNPQGALNSVVWSQKLNVFVAVGDSGFAAISSNGSVWNRISVASTTLNLSSITWAQELEMFVVISSSTTVGVTKKIFTSVDGINWFIRNSGTADTSYTSIVWNRFYGVFVGISNAGTSNRVILTKSIGTDTLLNKNSYLTIDDRLNYFDYTINNISVTVGTLVEIFPMINEEYEFTFILDTSIYSSLPSGLSLNPLTGEISGTVVAQQENRTYTIRATNELNRVIISRINIKISSSLENITDFTYPETILAKDFNNNSFILRPSFSSGNNISFTSTTLPSGVILDPTSGLITGNLSSFLPLTEYTITASNLRPSTATFKLQIGCDILKTNITVGEFYIFSSVDTINNRIEEFFNYSLGYISKGSYCNANFGPSRGLLSKNFFFNSIGSFISESILGIVLYRKVKKSDNTALNSFLVFEVKGNLVNVPLSWNKITFRNNVYLKGTANVFYNSITDSTVYIFNNQITNPYFYQNGYTEIIINNASS